MKPTDQTIFGHGGNCLAACIASILEIPIETVPNFCGLYGDDEWFDRMNEWLHALGLVGIAFKTEDPTFSRQWLRHAWCIVSGPASRGFLHCTVWRNGELVHDPHPSRDGLKAVHDVIVFASTDPARHMKPTLVYAEQREAERYADRYKAMMLAKMSDLRDPEIWQRHLDDLGVSPPRLTTTGESIASELGVRPAFGIDGKLQWEPE